MYRIGIDLGGTNIAVGVVDAEMKIVFSSSAPTNLPQSAANLAKNIARFVFQILEQADIPASEIESAGIGIPGTVNPDTGMVEYANNFDFSQIPFPKMLGELFPFPLRAANDAKAAAWGEYKTGAGCGSSSMLMITLGTGVGGAMIADGMMIDGFNHAAGEIGHMVIERNGRPCTCGRRGCFEVYASATALVTDAKEAALKDHSSLLYTLSDGNMDKVNGKMIFDAVKENDEVTKAVFARFISYLAEGTANLINIFQPEIVCIGGGLSGAGETLLAPLRTKIAPLIYSRDSKANATLVCAKLGNDAGIIGAALL